MFGRRQPLVCSGAMSEGLASQYEPEPEALWDALCKLLLHLEGTVDRTSFIDGCLERIVDLSGADRGLLILIGPEGEREIVNARGQGGALTDEERREISQTILERALEERRPIVWQAEESSRSTSIVAFGIWKAMAVPLLVDGGTRLVGVLYVDLRRRSKLLGERQREFIRAAGVLVSVVLRLERRLTETTGRLEQARARRTEEGALPTLDDLVRHPSMARVRKELETAVQSDLPILITGESGTGKTLLAHAIAEAAEQRPVVRAVLGFSDDLNTITSQLFGHLRGSFSGAHGKREGLVEFADGGVLILDEVLNMPVQAQQLLLDFTQFGTYRPLGYDRREPKRARVRLIAATNGDLKAAMADGRFREDLYHRLAAVELTLPPLRERREEIPDLVQTTLDRLDGADRWTLGDELRTALRSRSLRWPGNIRQLERIVQRARERARLRAPGAGELTLGDMDLEVATSSEPSHDENAAIGERWLALQQSQRSLQEAEVALIREALESSGGVVAKAARALGIARTTLASRVQTLNLSGVGKPDA